METEKKLTWGRKRTQTPQLRGTLVECRSLQHTHTCISQLHTDETPTARHSVVTHAVIAFPPAVSDNTGNSGVHHCGASSRSYCSDGESRAWKRLTMTNNSRSGLISHTPMDTENPMMKKWTRVYVHTMESPSVTPVLQSFLLNLGSLRVENSSLNCRVASLLIENLMDESLVGSDLR